MIVMPKQIMVSDEVYKMLTERKGKMSFSQVIKLKFRGKDTLRKKDPRKLLKIKPIDFGPGSENLSTEIDEVLYGDRP
jgi:predicted CopG family antitoxin